MSNDDTMTHLEAIRYYLKDLPDNYVENDMVPVRIPFLKSLETYFAKFEPELKACPVCGDAAFACHQYDKERDGDRPGWVYWVCDNIMCDWDTIADAKEGTVEDTRYKNGF